jgi:hypothetical protein
MALSWNLDLQITSTLFQEVVMSEENKALVRRWFEEVWNKGAPRRLMRCSPLMALLMVCLMSPARQ